MQTIIHCRPELLQQWLRDIEEAPEAFLQELQRSPGYLASLVHDAATAARLHVLVNSPHTDDFLQATRLEAVHQVERFGHAHDRSKSAENWFWLVGYLAGKCLRACVEGDRTNALHHTISSAAALLNWHAAIQADRSGRGIGADDDIRPTEGATK